MCSGSSTWRRVAPRAADRRHPGDHAAGGFDACFLGVGSQIGKRAYIPAGDARKITDAVGVLHQMEGEHKPLLGRRVIVYGGGNTAIDVARTARRLGAEESVIVYRRTRDKMPAHSHEVSGALEEGVKLKWLSTITAADEETITVEDGPGRRWFPAADRWFETMPADSVVLALRPGRRPRPAEPAARSIDRTRRRLRSDANRATGVPAFRRRRHGRR